MVRVAKVSEAEFAVLSWAVKARLLIAGLAVVSVFGQSRLPDSPDFASTLNQVLDAVKLGTRTLPTGNPTLPLAFAGRSASSSTPLKLPGAFLCNWTEAMYRCIWETKPNKYSMAVLLDDIVQHVNVALPDTWSREKGQTTLKRYGEFTDSRGDITITVLCDANDLTLAPGSYTVSLSVHRTQTHLFD